MAAADAPEEPKQVRDPSLADAIIPLVPLVVMKNGHSWDEVQHAAQNSLASIASAIFILLAVGVALATGAITS